MYLARATAGRPSCVYSQFAGSGVGLAVVVIGNNGNFGYSSLKFRKLDVGFGRANRFLGVDLVESIDKRLILCIEITTNR